MNIDKFMSMLFKRKLYFSNINQFQDKFEGGLSVKSIREVKKKHLLNENTPIKKDDEFFWNKEWIETKVLPEHKDVALLLNSFQRLLKDFSNHLMFCNCWFLKENESHSMWAEYGDKSPTSIAIQTTIGDIIESFESTRHRIHIGKVKYKNYEKDHITSYEYFLSKDLTKHEHVLELFYDPIMHKRDIYDDEHEVRAVVSFDFVCEDYLDRVYTTEIPFYSDQLFKNIVDVSFFDRAKVTNLMKGVPKGIEIQTDLDKLLKKVVIPPNANEYFIEPLKKLMENNNLDPGIVKLSKIKEVPF